MDLNTKLQQLREKDAQGQVIKVMIIGLGSVGCYLLDYLVGLEDVAIEIIVAGRNREKLVQDVNIIKIAATIRKQLRCKIVIDGACDLDHIETISVVIDRHRPDIIVNSSRVYAGLKYGSISWHNLRAYGIWTPLSIRYMRNIMEAYADCGSNSIVINTSYSDAVIPWLKSARKSYPDFGSGNLNHLIPRIKFYVAGELKIPNLNDIDVTLATSHFHDVVVSREGHTERQEVLLDIRYNGQVVRISHSEIWKHCAIPMPVDQKRNMMNASSNFNIIQAILDAVRYSKKVKIHSPGVLGEMGGYPFVIDGTEERMKGYFDESVFGMEQMQEANRRSIALDGIEDVTNGNLVYTDTLVAKIKQVFNVELPKIVHFDEIDKVGDLLIQRIIKNKSE